MPLYPVPFLLPQKPESFITQEPLKGLLSFLPSHNLKDCLTFEKQNRPIITIISQTDNNSSTIWLKFPSHGRKFPLCCPFRMRSGSITGRKHPLFSSLITDFSSEFYPDSLILLLTTGPVPAVPCTFLRGLRTADSSIKPEFFQKFILSEQTVPPKVTGFFYEKPVLLALIV